MRASGKHIATSGSLKLPRYNLKSISALMNETAAAINLVMNVMKKGSVKPANEKARYTPIYHERLQCRAHLAVISQGRLAFAVMPSLNPANSMIWQCSSK